MKIGVLHGMENTFPPALVQRINDKQIHNLHAETLRIGPVQAGAPSGYDVLIDRISQDVDFYSAFLKNAAATGTIVLNDPFRASSTDAFYITAAAAAAGVPVPRTVVLPHKEHPPGVTVQSLRNLQFPLDWDGVFAYVGFPALLKPVKPGRWKTGGNVDSPDAFFRAYDRTGSAAMILQQLIAADELYRCYVVGQQVRVIAYNPANPHGERYSPELPPAPIARQLADRSRAIMDALGFEVAVAEFAVENDAPYLVEVVHDTPNADSLALGEHHFEWLVENVAQLAIDFATGQRRPPAEDRELISARAVAAR